MNVIDLIAQYDGFIIDMFGVVYREGGRIGDSNQTLHLIQKAGKPYCFLSNTGEILPAKLRHILQTIDIAVPIEQIFTSGLLLKRYFQEQQLTGQPILNIGLPECAEYIRRAGGIPLPHEDIENPAVYLKAAAIVIGYYRQFDLIALLNASLNALLHKDIPIIVTNTDKVVPKNETEVKLTTGAFGYFFETLSQKKAVFLGKPNPLIFDQCHRQFFSGKDRVLVIGDTLETDIKGARTSGFDSLLVKTGSTYIFEAKRNEVALNHLFEATGIFPDYVADSFSPGSPVSRYRDHLP